MTLLCLGSSSAFGPILLGPRCEPPETVSPKLASTLPYKPVWGFVSRIPDPSAKYVFMYASNSKIIHRFTYRARDRLCLVSHQPNPLSCEHKNQWKVVRGHWVYRGSLQMSLRKELWSSSARLGSHVGLGERRP